MRLLRADIDLLPGSGDDIHAAAAAIRSTKSALDLVVGAADKLGQLVAGDHWRGPAWAAFVSTVEQHQLGAASANAIDRMEEAALAVEAFASTHDRLQNELRWCRREFEAVVDAALTGDEDAVGRANQLLDEAERIRGVHDHAEGALSAAFDRLDDATMFATPPDSLGDQIRSVAGTAWDAQWEFRIGAYEGVRSLVETMALLANPLGPIVVAHHLYTHRDEYEAAFEYAVDNPGDFTREFAKEFVDWDTWADNPARAAGRLVPDLALTALTFGAGGAAKGGVRAVDAGVDATRAAGRASRALDDAADAADAIAVPDLVVDVDAAVVDVGDSLLEPECEDGG